MTGFTRKIDTVLQAQRKRQKALTTMGLGRNETPTVAELKEHYVLLVQSLHPDSPARVKGLTANVTLEEIRQAKDYLIKDLKNG